jgi:hypothetical protein
VSVNYAVSQINHGLMSAKGTRKLEGKLRYTGFRLLTAE